MTKVASARILWCAAVAVFVMAVLGPRWRTGFAPVFPDSHSYLAVAARHPWSPRFWVDQRPPTYPLFIFLLGSAPAWVVVAQTLCWVAAWSWLMATAWHQLRARPIAIAAVAVLGLMAVEARWALWNTQILTESLSGSLAVAGVAAWWRWYTEPGRFRTAMVLVVTLAWMFLRDSNAVSTTAVAVPAVFVAMAVTRRPERGGPRRQAATLALGVIVFGGSVSLATQLGAARNTATFHNNMGLRWLPSDSMREYFDGHGLPASDALDARVGKDAWADGESFLRAPELAEYRAWADGEGRLWAAWSMVARVGWYLDGLHDEIGVHLRTDFAPYDTYGVGSRLPDRPLGPLDPAGSGWAMSAWGIVVVGLGAAALRAGKRREVLFVSLLGAPVLADLYLSYAGDAVEVGRHLSGGLLRFGVVAVVGAAILADVLVTDE